ncbi:hypothetical protein GGI35DRAFT_247723 [Trichoderma velutinum]
MGQFRLFPDYFIEEATRLCDELMCGLKPTVELTKIKDELTNSQKGYSFVTNPKNDLSEGYLELCKQACSGPQKECLSRRGRWNWEAVYKYKRKEEAFRGLLGLAMHITGGQTPRWSELLSLWCENGEFGERGCISAADSWRLPIDAGFRLQSGLFHSIYETISGKWP